MLQVAPYILGYMGIAVYFIIGFVVLEVFECAKRDSRVFYFFCVLFWLPIVIFISPVFLIFNEFRGDK